MAQKPTLIQRQMTLRSEAFNSSNYDDSNRGIYSFIVMLLCIVGIVIVLNKFYNNNSTQNQNGAPNIPNNNIQR